jgi:Holliday junction resolvasome RuvABC endonuclease subunit
MTVWGCDPASKKIAMFSGDHRGLIHRELLEVKRTDRNSELLELRRQLEYVLRYDDDPVIYCEEPVVAGARNLRSTILVAETVGVVLALNARVHLVPVSSWKKATVGNGNASKADVTEWLTREHPSYASECHDTQHRESQDLRDAAAIYLYGKDMDSSRQFLLTSRHR